MRKNLLAVLAAAALLPSMASAQSAQEVRNGQREVERDRQEVQRHTRNGDTKNANAARQEMREDARENREDWRDYRNSHRSTFRMGTYRGPRNYRYRPVAVGYQFQQRYYSSNYWVANPARYRLPAAGRNQRWVRYGNDVVLVNIRNGRVIRVYRSFFW
jgi:Ni/Co efflux regulator RcnB